MKTPAHYRGMSRAFTKELTRRNSDPSGRCWTYVPYDQLTDAIGPLARLEPGDAGIVLIESEWKGRRRPYHKQKLALILANTRQFALEQAARGVSVRHIVTRGPYREGLKSAIEELGPLRVMRPAERELRMDIAPLVGSGLVVERHEGWLTTDDDFDEGAGERPWRMDTFYRHVRQRTGVLIDADNKPQGGKYSHDADNREFWTGDPPAPEPLVFEPDEITREVGGLIEARFGHHPGTLNLSRLPATREDAERLWLWAMRSCMTHFGPYEDAMSTRSRTIFHTLISSVLNIHRLLPRQVVADVLELDIPLSSKEGFVRQVLGWREFVRHVSERTDGFRSFGAVIDDVGDAGFGRYRGEEWTTPAVADSPPSDQGAPNFLEATSPLPPAFWGAPSGLSCLDRVVSDVWETGYGHHITRLMILSNLATLLEIGPRELTDWFWVAYTDAYDWVVEPNVLGMGTFAAGGCMTTKPYVSGAAYIHRMSDYCEGCRFDPKRTCPITRL